MQNKPRILVNGCSHTSAVIPTESNISNNPNAISWAEIFCNKINAELINLAYGGKSNNVILEETIRYLINDDNINHVIIYYTDWKRLNFYNKEKSFKWIPGNIKSQFERLDSGKDRRSQYSSNEHRHYLFMKNEVGKIALKENYNKNYILKSIGDASDIHEIIVCGTLTYCLYELCLNRKINLTLINLAPLGDSKEDAVWINIPNNLFLFSNAKLSSIFYHFYKKYNMPDRGHFEQAFHYELAQHVEAHYENKIQIEGRIKIPEENPIYDYTN